MIEDLLSKNTETRSFLWNKVCNEKPSVELKLLFNLSCPWAFHGVP